LIELRWISYLTASMVSPVGWEKRRRGERERRRRADKERWRKGEREKGRRGEVVFFHDGKRFEIFFKNNKESGCQIIPGWN